MKKDGLNNRKKIAIAIVSGLAIFGIFVSLTYRQSKSVPVNDQAVNEQNIIEQNIDNQIIDETTESTELHLEPYASADESGNTFLANDFEQMIPENAIPKDNYYEVTQEDGSVAAYGKTNTEYSIKKMDTETIYEPATEVVKLEYNGQSYDISEYIKEYYYGEPIVEITKFSEVIGWEFTADNREFKELKNYIKGTAYNADEDVTFTENPLYFALKKDDQMILYFTGSKTYAYAKNDNIIVGKSEYKPTRDKDKLYISLLSLYLSEDGPDFEIIYNDSEVIYKTK